MPENEPILPKVLQATGAAAWELPKREMRQTRAHSHAEAQLCGLDAGLAILESAAGSWLCPPGRCVWIPAGMVHSVRSCGKIGGWMLHLKTAASEGLPLEPRVLALTPLLKEVVRRIAGWRSESETNAARGRLVDVLKDEIAGASQVTLHLPVPDDPALKRLVSLMAAGADATKNLAALAHEAGVSERSLFRKFQHETGMSPGRWRRQMQVLRSLELLAKGHSVLETSLEVGYEGTGAFTRAFRSVVGVTPAAYAKGQRTDVALGI